MKFEMLPLSLKAHIIHNVLGRLGEPLGTSCYERVSLQNSIL